MTLPSHGPDLVRRMAAMERRLAELERDRGAVHPPMHRLADTKLHDVKDGEVPVWDKASGYWTPGPAGVKVARYFGQADVPHNTLTSPVALTVSPRVQMAGLSVVFSNRIQFDVGGIYQIAGTIEWNFIGGGSDAAGRREVLIESNVAAPPDEANYTGHDVSSGVSAYGITQSTAPTLFYLPAESIVTFKGRQTSGATSPTCKFYLFVLKVAGL